MTNFNSYLCGTCSAWPWILGIATFTIFSITVGIIVYQILKKENEKNF